MSVGISNHYITSVLNPSCVNFRGVYSANTIPLRLLKVDVFSIVCNLSKVDEPGSHFVAVIVQPQEIFYMDSFGSPCITPEIVGFLKKINKPVVYNTRQIQDFSSKLCGFYSILFVLYFDADNGVPLVFDYKNLLQNDVTCVKKICEILNKSIY